MINALGPQGRPDVRQALKGSSVLLKFQFER
jgi:hypothetical protein